MFKITEKELAPEVLKKLNQLDNIANGFDENQPNGYISYNKNGFYFKKLGNKSDKITIYSEDEIINLEESLISPKKNTISSLYEDLRLDKVYHTATRKFLYNVDPSDIFNFGATIVISKIFGENIVAVTAAGEFIKNNISLGNAMVKAFSINIIDKIKETFSISDQLDPYDVCDIAEIDENTYIMGTTDFGIYKITLNGFSVELICHVSKLKAVEYAHNGNLFIATDDFVAQYDLKTGMRIDKYTVIKNALEVPTKIIKTDIGMFVIAAPAGIQITNKLVHFWKIDDAKVNYNLRNGLIPNHSLDSHYQIINSFVDDKFLYLIGNKLDKVFVWKYSLKTFELTEDIIDLNVTVDGFIVINDFYIILADKILYIVKDNNIEMRLRFNEPVSGLDFKNGEIFSRTKTAYLKIALPVFVPAAASLQYKVYNGKESCNNIDIFVKGATRNDRITFTDVDTDKEIIPYYYIIYNGNAIIKLSNCKATNIKMSISVTDKTSLGGFVVKTNRMFIKE